MARQSAQKRKANTQEDASDGDEPPTPPEPPTTSRRVSTRTRTLTDKQEALMQDQNDQLQARIAKLERENARLARKAGKAKSTGSIPQTGDEDENEDQRSVESEEESDSIVQARFMKSKFESRGIYESDSIQQKKPKLRRLDDPAARKLPVTAATSSSRVGTRPPTSVPPPSQQQTYSHSHSPPLSDSDDVLPDPDRTPPPSLRSTTPPTDLPALQRSDIPPRHRRALEHREDIHHTSESARSPAPSTGQRTSTSTPPESSSRIPQNRSTSRTSPTPAPRARTVPLVPTTSRAPSRSAGGSSQSSRTPQPDTQTDSVASVEELPFRGGVKPTGDAKASDYEPHASKLILAACRHFEARVLTDDPFPDDAKMEPWVKEAWAHTCGSVQRNYKLPDRVQKLIMSRTSHARGALKDCIRPLVAPKYGFSSSTDEATKIANRALYERLLDVNNPEGPEPIFHYQNVDTLTGYARNEIVSHAIREQWFRNSESIGLRLPERFSPIREETLAIIFTAIEFCLDQWADGTFSDSARFTEKEYKAKYDNHLRLIQEWTELNRVVTEMVRKQMYEEARLASGAALTRTGALGLSATSRSRLQAELDEIARSLG